MKAWTSSVAWNNVLVIDTSRNLLEPASSVTRRTSAQPEAAGQGLAAIVALGDGHVSGPTALLSTLTGVNGHWPEPGRPPGIRGQCGRFLAGAQSGASAARKPDAARSPLLPIASPSQGRHQRRPPEAPPLGRRHASGLPAWDGRIRGNARAPRGDRFTPEAAISARWPLQRSSTAAPDWASALLVPAGTCHAPRTDAAP